MASTKTKPWQWAFFQRHANDDPGRDVPAQRFLDRVEERAAAKLMDVVVAVANCPPPAFAGGGKWEAMHDEMAGFYEVRVDFNGYHYRLFCLLERDDAAKKLGANTLVLIDGERKAVRTVISARRYKQVRALGDEYLARLPRTLFVDEDDDTDGR